MVGADVNSLLDSPGSGTFRYSVRSFNAGGASAWAGPASASTSDSSSSTGGSGKPGNGFGRNK